MARSFSPDPDHSGGGGGRHGQVAPHRLAIHSCHGLDRTQPFVSQPQTRDFSDLVHTDLPEHPPPLTSLVDLVASRPTAAPALLDPGWSHHWRKGGPMLLAELTSRWSHTAGGRQWRNTRSTTSGYISCAVNAIRLSIISAVAGDGRSRVRPSPPTTSAGWLWRAAPHPRGKPARRRGPPRSGGSCSP